MATSATDRRARRDAVSLGVVIVAAVVVSAVLWHRYDAQWSRLWSDVIHDRSAHLDFGLQPASDLLHLRVVDLLRDLNAFRTWPLLHDGVLVGAAMVVTGVSPRFAVLPSLVAFAGTAVLAFLLARRLVATWGNLAGIAAATLVLGSPALRAYATDVMIESTGACLTLLVLYAAVRVRQQPTLGGWRFLAIALSALFFTKYNYWLLAAVAVGPLLWPLRTDWRATHLPAALRWTVRVAVGGLVVVAAADGFLGSRAVAAAMVAGWIMAASTVWWSRTTGRAFLAAQPAARMLLWWQVLPALVWCCLPGKLQTFLWAIVPFTNSGERASGNPFGGVDDYARAWIDDYQSGVVVALATLALVVIALVAWRRGRLRPGTGMVVLLLALALVTTLPHPNRKSRFLHTITPVAWVLAGAGLSVAVEGLGRRRTWVAAVVGGLVVVALVPALVDDAHAPEGGITTARPSALAITDAYLPALADASAPAIVGNLPLRFLARWTYQERYGRATRPVTEIPGFDATTAGRANREALDAWLASGSVDRLVVVDIGRRSPWYQDVPETAGLRRLPRLMAEQDRFVAVGARRVARDTTVTLWRRPAAVSTAAGAAASRSPLG